LTETWPGIDTLLSSTSTGYTFDMDPREEELLTHVAAGTDIWTALAATSEDEQPPKSGWLGGSVGRIDDQGGQACDSANQGPATPARSGHPRPRRRPPPLARGADYPAAAQRRGMGVVRAVWLCRECRHDQ